LSFSDLVLSLELELEDAPGVLVEPPLEEGLLALGLVLELEPDAALPEVLPELAPPLA
jgi:hypothetical protein